jgi:uncharacterized protein (TIGR03437 family)
MRKLFGFLILSTGMVLAQSVETRVFRAILSPANEVPPISGLNASGVATIEVHAVKNAAGEIVSGSADFIVNFTFPDAASVTGLHIHPGAAGVNGPVTVNTGISAASPVAVEGGARTNITRQAQVLSTATAAVDTLKGLWNDPSQYYANLHTAANPGGAIRGQVMLAETTVVMAQMNPANEVPPLTLEASAFGTAVTHVTRDSSGAINSAEILFDVNYSFPSAVMFTGLHIHTGAAGINGPVTLNSGLTGPLASAENGRGRLQQRFELPITNAATLAAIEGIRSNPAGHYMNLHTTVNTGGAVRAQVRLADKMTFNVNMTPAEEVPPIANLEASAPAGVTLYTLRDDTGRVIGGHVVYDVNHRFPENTQFTGLHIHDNVAGQNGPVTLNSGLAAATTPVSATGFGNLNFRFNVFEGQALTSLNSLVADPTKHYLNLHTTTNAGGAVRAQMAAPRTGRPAVGAIVSAAGAVDAAAPTGLISLFGARFANVSTDLSGWAGASVPTTLNGVTVTIDGRAAPLLFVSDTQINAQLPAETTAGTKAVTVRVNDETSDAGSVTVATGAPALFTYPGGAIVVKNSNFSLITADNPAASGEILVIYLTGMGQTSPALRTGVVAPGDTFARTTNPTVTIGGQNAEVIYSIASPGFLGLNQIAVRMPTGVTGNVPVVVRVGDRSSNSANIVAR